MIMFKQILVPLDGSNLSEASLVPAAYLAERLQSSVTLLHVIEQDPPSEVHKERHLTQPAEAEAYLKDAAERAFPAKVKVQTHVHSAAVSDVARSIVEHVTNEFRPDLIIICSHGRSGMHDVLFGSIAQQILAAGRTPLLLIKPGEPAFTLDRVLIPLDPDSMHDYTLSTAGTLGKTFEVKLQLLSVIPTFSTLAGEQAATGNLMPVTTQAFLDLKEENARRDLQTHIEDYHEAGVEAAWEVARGDPAPTIVKTADQLEADMIILSTHRKAGMGAFWARSVAPKVAQKTRRPVLLIPLTANE